MMYVNEENLGRLIYKIEKSMVYGGLLPSKFEADDIFVLHEALMILDLLVKDGFIKFENEGFSIKAADNKKEGVEEE